MLTRFEISSVFQMSWTRAGAQALLHVKTAVLNGTLGPYTGHQERLPQAA